MKEIKNKRQALQDYVDDLIACGITHEGMVMRLELIATRYKIYCDREGKVIKVEF